MARASKRSVLSACVSLWCPTLFRDPCASLSFVQIFAEIDHNRDGQVDVYEFESALDKIGKPPTWHDVRRR
jgi:hypothetical protein